MDTYVSSGSFSVICIILYLCCNILELSFHLTLTCHLCFSCEKNIFIHVMSLSKVSLVIWPKVWVKIQVCYTEFSCLISFHPIIMFGIPSASTISISSFRIYSFSQQITLMNHGEDMPPEYTKIYSLSLNLPNPTCLPIITQNVDVLTLKPLGASDAYMRLR